MNWKKPFSLIVFCLMASNAMAELNFNGFLSVGAGALTDDDEITSYEGFDGDWSTDPDTVFALQVSAPISDKVTATGQLIARGEDDYNLEAEWAYLSYSVSDNFDVRVGRLRAPFFVYSDFLDVGYAYPFISPPSQSYRFVFSTVEGVDAIYQSQLGSWDSTVQAYYGRLTDETVLGGESVDLDLVGFTGINWALTKDWFTVRMTYNQAETSIGLPTALSNSAGTGFLDILNGAGFTSVADALNPDEEDASFYGIGFNIDYNDWLVISEYTVLDIDKQAAFSDDESIYILVGKRFGDFTYHVTWDHNENDPDYDFLNVIPAGVDPGLDALRAGAISTIPETEATDVTLGVRWDFAPGTAFKFEVTNLDRESAIAADRDGTLVRFAFDMVF